MSVHYFSSSRSMPIFISVEKGVLFVCMKSALIMSFSVRVINKTPLNYHINDSETIRNESSSFNRPPGQAKT